MGGFLHFLSELAEAVMDLSELPKDSFGSARKLRRAVRIITGLLGLAVLALFVLLAAAAVDFFREGETGTAAKLAVCAGIAFVFLGIVVWKMWSGRK